MQFFFKNDQNENNRQIVEINKFSKFPMEIAHYLNLPNLH